MFEDVRALAVRQDRGEGRKCRNREAIWLATTQWLRLAAQHWVKCRRAADEQGNRRGDCLGCRVFRKADLFHPRLEILCAIGKGPVADIAASAGDPRRIANAKLEQRLLALRIGIKAARADGENDGRAD